MKIDDAFRSAFAERARILRGHLGITQAQMAAALGAADNTAVSRMETGELQTIPFRVLGRLVGMAIEVGFSGEWLLTGNMVSPTADRRDLLESLAKLLIQERGGDAQAGE